MDANNFDPGADEAVQRIKSSLNSIDERTECHQKPDDDKSTEQDPGADEAVQRIQNSLSRIDTRAEAHREAKKDPNPLTGMLAELAASAHLDTQSSERYKLLAEKDNVTAVLHEAAREMIAVASTTAAVLREKHGLKVDRDGYKLLKNLVTRYEELSEQAKESGDGDWSSRGLWEIERELRGSTTPAGTGEANIARSDDYEWEPPKPRTRITPSEPEE